jgi:signal transduction histidine kinase
MDGVFDPKRIERAFFNLILNACEAMEHRQGQISVEILSSEDLFEVRLRDNGPGVPPAIIDTLFNPFVSLGKPNGTGLGLAIVNKIFQEHHGSIVVETTSEAGTVFLVKLPRSLQIANVDAKPVVV